MKPLILISLLLAIGWTGCNKKEFLETKPSSDLFVPSTLEDFQALLDHEQIMGETPVLGELSADNFYLPATYWQTLNSKEKNAYIWQGDIFQGQGDVQDWNVPYKQVFQANVVLDGLPKVTVNSTNEQNWNAIKGAALFARAHAFYQVAQLFASTYNSQTATASLGIPLRLHSGIDEPSVRSTLQQTYDRIQEDLIESARLLPAIVPFKNRNRPSKPAAYAMLARVCLSMSAYPQAKAYADSCLILYNNLMDYNNVDSVFLSTNFPFSATNSETLYQSKFLTTTSVMRGFSARSTIIDSNFYKSYDDINDLRKIAFFYTNSSLQLNVKGSYTGLSFCFTGLATDEVYITRAECLARMGNVSAAMIDLNTLLEKRWRKGTFAPRVASNTEQALDIILKERRKELPFRGLRWTDLRRLNLTNRKVDLTRQVGGQSYSLPANDPRYVILIPPDVITLSGIPQNPR